MTDTDIREQGKQSRYMDTSDSWQDSDTPAGASARSPARSPRPSAAPSQPSWHPPASQRARRRLD